jgi:SAM-dependent methyltransferase
MSELIRGNQKEEFNMLNLGCGYRTLDREGVSNIDWSIHLRIKKSIFAKIILKLIGEERAERIRSQSERVLAHDLRKGIPAENDSIDVVYHSHVLEHIDREAVPSFLKEIHRVLKVNGVLRIVVPDMEFLCRRYIENISRIDADPDCRELNKHGTFIAKIIEQSVRREASGTSNQPYFRRKFENLILGDARARGETHQWMYDRISLAHLLRTNGFEDVKTCAYDESRIKNWNEWGLDMRPCGQEYTANSLYIECVKKH